MKRSFLIAFVFILSLYSFFGGISEGKELDGFEWARMNVLEKAYFIRGWIQGGMDLYLNVYFDTLLINFANVDPNLQKCVGITDKISKGVLERNGNDIYDFTTIQIVETVDTIYSDARVKLWNISKIMPIVKGRLKGGWTVKDVDEVIALHQRAGILQQV